MSENKPSYHLFATAAVTAEGKIERGNGITSEKRESGASTGKYRLRYSPKFSAKAALVVSAAGAGGKTHVRFAHTPDSGQERAQRGDVDSYRVHLSAEDPVLFSNAPFSAIAALSGGSDVLPCRHLDGTEVRVIAGAIDLVGERTQHTLYGGGTLNVVDSSTGSYIVDFPADAFLETPWVVATPWTDQAKMRTVDVSEVSRTRARIEFRNEGGSRVGSRFHFLAVGKAAAGSGSTGRLLTGVVNLNGSLIWAGSGFSSEKVIAPATYEIRLDQGKSFGKSPVVVAVAEHAPEEHVRQAQVHDIGVGSFRLDIYGYQKKENTVADKFNDSSFNFIAFAPT